mmetsp:Transcript_6204/g.12247  ORF Transcript_6204/g.12247 Transcript_6204/m.12247 type:complete len:302 (-) Transcript_6204:96-1001(-)
MRSGRQDNGHETNANDASNHWLPVLAIQKEIPAEIVAITLGRIAIPILIVVVVLVKPRIIGPRPVSRPGRVVARRILRNGRQIVAIAAHVVVPPRSMDHAALTGADVAASAAIGGNLKSRVRAKLFVVIILVSPASAHSANGPIARIAAAAIAPDVAQLAQKVLIVRNDLIGPLRQLHFPLVVPPLSAGVVQSHHAGCRGGGGGEGREFVFFLVRVGGGVVVGGVLVGGGFVGGVEAGVVGAQEVVEVVVVVVIVGAAGGGGGVAAEVGVIVAVVAIAWRVVAAEKVHGLRRNGVSILLEK